MSSAIYGKASPNREHLLRSRGIAGEVKDLRQESERVTGAGVQYVNITSGPPNEVLTTSGISIVVNTSGSTQYVTLPNGVDGCVKEIVNGNNGQVSGHQIRVNCENNLSNTYYILPVSASVKLTYVADLGGWVALNYCSNVNANWD